MRVARGRKVQRAVDPAFLPGLDFSSALNLARPVSVCPVLRKPGSVVCLSERVIDAVIGTDGACAKVWSDGTCEMIACRKNGSDGAWDMIGTGGACAEIRSAEPRAPDAGRGAVDVLLGRPVRRPSGLRHEQPVVLYSARCRLFGALGQEPAVDAWRCRT
eukprot:3166390-Rhodomonas_salina.1